jgi:hypothetical protein
MIFPFPVIHPEDYESFRREVGPDLANTYDEWLNLHREQIDEARRRGLTIAEIEVKFDEFIGFCRATGTPPDLKTLRDFTVKKTSGEQ